VDEASKLPADVHACSWGWWRTHECSWMREKRALEREAREKVGEEREKKEEMNKIIWKKKYIYIYTHTHTHRPLLYGVHALSNGDSILEVRSIRQSRLTSLWPIFQLFGPDLCRLMLSAPFFLLFFYYFIQQFCFCSFYPNPKK
jgi:hypothetical protein